MRCEYDFGAFLPRCWLHSSLGLHRPQEQARYRQTSTCQIKLIFGSYLNWSECSPVHKCKSEERYGIEHRVAWRTLPLKGTQNIPIYESRSQRWLVYILLNLRELKTKKLDALDLSRVYRVSPFLVGVRNTKTLVICMGNWRHNDDKPRQAKSRWLYGDYHIFHEVLEMGFFRLSTDFTRGQSLSNISWTASNKLTAHLSSSNCVQTKSDSIPVETCLSSSLNVYPNLDLTPSLLAMIGPYTTDYRW